MLPGQNGEQGVKFVKSGLCARGVCWGAAGLGLMLTFCLWTLAAPPELREEGAGRPDVTGEGRDPAPGATGRMETPEGREGSCCLPEDWEGLGLVGTEGLEPAGLCFPTGGCSLLSITVYFWSVLAEKERVVPTLTLVATLRGTLSSTAFPPVLGLTRIDTWSLGGLPGAAGLGLAVC